MIQRSTIAARSLALLSLLFLILAGPSLAVPFQSDDFFGEDEEEDLFGGDDDLFGDDEEPVEVRTLDPKLVEAITALEFAPNDMARLEATARIALAVGEPDIAFWYASLALASLPETSQTKKTREGLIKLRAEIGAPGTTPEELQNEFSRGLFDMAKGCEKQKLYANAASLLELCIGTSMQARAEERLAKMFSKKKALESLIESGINVEIPGGRRVNKKKRRLVNKKNTTWEDPYEVKGKYYIVRSDMGYDYTHAFLDAMEQMNSFYRTVFNYKVRGGTMRSCRIDVYKNRQVFDAHEKGADGTPIPPTVKGFFSPTENRVATYDPRSEGGTIDDLWSTLFHESSHQFTAAVLPGLMLAWLNEGTASYFEGAFLQPGGSVAKNRIPRTRLRSLYSLLGFQRKKKGGYKQERKPRSDAPTLEEVITFYQPGSYPGAYYPYGWGLIFFFHNYEDENSERIYLPIYKEFMLTYKSGGNHDIKARFVEYFVTKAAVPGVDNFDAFEEHWMAWIHDLYSVHYGGTEQSDVLVARGELQSKNEKFEYALASFRWALEKNPKNNKARMLYAETAMELERWDLATFQLRQLEASTRRIIDRASPMPTIPGKTAAEARAHALAKLGKVNARIRDGLVTGVDQFVTLVQDAAQIYVDGDRPLSALYLLKSSARLVNGDARLITAAEDIELETGVSLKRGYRPNVPNDLEGWDARKTFSAKGGVLSVRSGGGINTAVFEDAPPIPYRWEVDVELEDKGRMALAGLTFGSTLQDGQLLAWLANMKQAAVLESSPDETGLVPTDMVGIQKAADSHIEPSTTKAHLAVEVKEDRILFFVNGNHVLSKDMTEMETRGRVGVFVQDTSAKFTNMRLEY